MPTSLQKWQSLTQDPRVVDFFTDFFERLGVRVVNTKESFTCIHRGDHIDFEPTLDESKVDYTVQIQSFQVDRLADHARTGQLNTAEQYRVVRTFFSPATAAILKHPMLSNGVLRRLWRVEDLIHVYLKSPLPEEPYCEDVSHTLIYVKGQWLVIPGISGKPRRTFHLTMNDAVLYHKRIFAAVKANKKSAWFGLFSWYVTWRKTVSKLS